VTVFKHRTTEKLSSKKWINEYGSISTIAI